MKIDYIGGKMTISELLKGTEYILADDFEVTGLSSNSKATNGCLFFCLDGTKNRGIDYARDAIANGAIGVVSTEPLGLKNNVVVTDIKQAMWITAMRYWDAPLKKVKLIGVTGTNGKTTTTHFIADILNYAGKNTGIIGTLGAKWNGKSIPLQNTTPGFFEFVEIIANMARDGVEYAVMEVSAHAIAQNRLLYTPFAIGVFTNLTQDHLDYFENIDSYRETKLSFFSDKSCVYRVVNADTQEGRRIASSSDAVVTYGIDCPSDVFAIDLKCFSTKTTFIANVFDDIYEIEFAILGKFNVYNLLASISVCTMLGVKGDILVEAIKRLKPPKGRFNVYKGKKTAIIDYAHTPDGLKNLLTTVRSVSKGRTIVVFGCGGDRDKSKRSQMGKIAEEYADIVVLTEDNSRSENTLDIIKDIAKEMISEPKVIPNRRQATEYAMHVADESDIVVIAGKGGEDYIERDVKIRYSDEQEVLRILADIT